ITHRISLLLALLLFYTAFGEEITDRLEIYVNEEMLTKDEGFKRELERCFRVAEKHVKTPELEKELKKAGCDTVFEEYEKIVEKATERYHKEIDRDYSQILKRYREKLLAYRKENLKVSVRNFAFGKDRYSFIMVEKPVDAKDIWVEVEDKRLPFCKTDRGKLFFLPYDGGGSLSIVVEEEDGYRERIGYSVEGRFEPFKPSVERDRVVLPSPVYRAYLTFGKLKKEFLSYGKENGCAIPSMPVERKPDGVFVEIPAERGIKTYRVYGR
ncbi:MAG: hypothetical protein GXN94_05435, partial [Aquificae bacterium]|nr:hypothetical protein [Aquificota bacterium]